ncbi:MAG: hypothetical protein ABSE82_17195 [Nitrososphaerales archaeon]
MHTAHEAGLYLAHFRSNELSMSHLLKECHSRADPFHQWKYAVPVDAFANPAKLRTTLSPHAFLKFTDIGDQYLGIGSPPDPITLYQ